MTHFPLPIVLLGTLVYPSLCIGAPSATYEFSGAIAPSLKGLSEFTESGANPNLAQEADDDGPTGRFAIGAGFKIGGASFRVRGDWTWKTPFYVEIPLLVYFYVSFKVILPDEMLPPEKRRSPAEAPHATD